MEKINDIEFELLTTYIHKISGIQLDESKGYLLETRLQPLVDAYGLKSFHELYQKAVSDTGGKVKTAIIDAITINETYFFRDNTPFEVLKHKVIPDLIDAKRRQFPNRRIPIRIWSAACSSGQEVYSIGIILLEMLSDIDQYDIYIYGSDISEEVVAKASYGKYNQFELERGLPKVTLQKYFNKVADGWRIKDQVRSLANFEVRDLMKPFSDMADFDIVLCRNVAIYFPIATRVKLFQKISRILKPHGSLIVGASESLSGTADAFEPFYYLRGVYYQLKNREQLVPQSESAMSKPIPAQSPKPVARKPNPPPAPPADLARKQLVDKKIEEIKLRRKKEREVRQTLKMTDASLKTKPKAEQQPKPALKPIKPAASIQPDDQPSLLDRLHGNEQKNRSLLSNVEQAETGKKISLLDQIRRRHSEEDKK